MLPVVFVQLVVSVVFVKNYIEDVTGQMSLVAAREVRLVLSTLAATEERRNVRTQIDDVSVPLGILVTPVEATAFDAPDRRSWYDFSGIIITEVLRERLQEVEVVDLSNDRVVRLVLDAEPAPVELTFDRRRVSAAAPHQLLVNMVFFSILITIVAFIYMRNQLRPIKRLANAAEAFGRGNTIPYIPAGATEVLLASRNRFALMHELRAEDEPTLPALLSKLAPVDLVLVEGYKRDAHPKVEAHRSQTGNPLIAPDDPTIRAVASDTALVLDRPVFDLDDTVAIADFILSEVGL